MKWWPKPSRREGWLAHWWAPALILLAALGLRLLRLGEANLWWDEALAIWAVRKGLLGVTLWTAGDVHPPLYFWSLWAWVQLVGEGEFAARVLSALYGVATVAVVYRLGCFLADRTTGLLAALLTAVARFHIWWSQELRMYVLAGLLGLLSLYCFLCWLRTLRSPQRRDHPALLLALYVLASAASLYTIYLMGALLLVENAIFLLALWTVPHLPRRKAWAGWLSAQGVVLALLAPWLAFSWGRMQTWSVAEPLSPALFARIYATLLTTGVSVEVERYTWAMILPLAVLAGGGLIWWGSWWPERRTRAGQGLEILALLLGVILPAVAVYLASLPRGLFYTPRVEARYFVPFAPCFWLLLAWSVVQLGRRRRALGWAAAALVVGLALAFLPGYYRGRYVRDHLASMVRAILSQADPGDVVLLDAGSRYPILLYDYERIAAPQRPPMIPLDAPQGTLTAEQVAEQLQPVAATYRRFWLAEVDVHLEDPQRLAAQWLEQRYPQVLALAYGPNTLRLYDPTGRPPGLAEGYVPQHALRTTIGSGTLRGWELPVTTFTAGDRIHISLLWEQPPRAPLLLQVRNARGQALLQRALPAATVEGPQRQQADFTLHTHIPAGRYTIVLADGQGAEITLGALRIAGTAPLPKAGPPTATMEARLGQGITLVGYRLPSARVSPGEMLTLDLYWRAEAKLDEDYTVFTHLLGQAYNPKTQGPVWGQHDAQPANAGYPTSQWLPGDTIVDRHVLLVDPNAPPGIYQLEVGLYNGDTGQRLPVFIAGQEQDDRVLLPSKVTVQGR